MGAALAAGAENNGVDVKLGVGVGLKRLVETGGTLNGVVVENGFAVVAGGVNKGVVEVGAPNMLEVLVVVPNAGVVVAVGAAKEVAEKDGVVVVPNGEAVVVGVVVPKGFAVDVAEGNPNGVAVVVVVVGAAVERVGTPKPENVEGVVVPKGVVAAGVDVVGVEKPKDVVAVDGVPKGLAGVVADGNENPVVVAGVGVGVVPNVEPNGVAAAAGALRAGEVLFFFPA